LTPLVTAFCRVGWGEYLLGTLLAGAEPSGKPLGRNPGKIFKNYALKSMDDVNAKLDEAAFYIERNPMLVKSITSFPHIAKSSDMEMV
jgi:hypothetical protein